MTHSPSALAAHLSCPHLTQLERQRRAGTPSVYAQPGCAPYCMHPCAVIALTRYGVALEAKGNLAEAAKAFADAGEIDSPGRALTNLVVNLTLPAPAFGTPPHKRTHIACEPSFVRRAASRAPTLENNLQPEPA